MNYYTSDLHLNHINILKMQDRKFKDINEMNYCLIENINSVVKNENNDKLFILGDLSHHCSAEETVRLISQIKCKKKYLVIGNHDKPEEIKKIAPDLFVDIQPYMEVYDHNTNFVLCHYPFASWKKQRAGWIHLHGHIHSKPAYNKEMYDKGIKRLDVGVEAHNYMPWSSKDIIKFFEGCKFNPELNNHHLGV